MWHKLIIRLVNRYIPQEKIDFTKLSDGSLEINLINRKRAMFRIRKNSEWNYVKKFIDKIMNLPNECQICYNEYENRHTCLECLNSMCIVCFLNIIRQNDGVTVCPYCSHSKRVVASNCVESYIDFVGSMSVDVEARKQQEEKRREQEQQQKQETITETETETNLTTTGSDSETAAVTENEACAKISCPCGGKYSKNREKNISTQRCIKNM